MGIYLYTYLDEGARLRLRKREAEDRLDLCALLASEDVVPVHIVAFSVLERREKIKTHDLAILLSQLAMVLEGGVSLLEALHYMQDESQPASYNALLKRLERGMLRGLSFSEAFASEKTMTPMLSHWLAIGERQGRLAVVLGEMAEYLQRQETLKKRLAQELMYPVMVLGAVMLVGLLLVLVVMPVLARQFMELGTELPVMMRFFLTVQDFLVAYGWLLLGLGVALGALIVINRAECARAAKAFVMRLRPLRVVATLTVYVPFARLFGQFLRSGVSAGVALEELCAYFDKGFFASEIVAIKEAVARGSKLSAAIAAADFVPNLAKGVLANSERVGKMPQALIASAEYYEKILFEQTSMALRLLEPLSVVGLGVVILLMAMGLFLPVLDSYQVMLHQ